MYVLRSPALEHHRESIVAIDFNSLSWQHTQRSYLHEFHCHPSPFQDDVEIITYVSWCWQVNRHLLFAILYCNLLCVLRLVERVLQGEGDIGKVVCSWALCLMYGDGSSAPSDGVLGNVGV